MKLHHGLCGSRCRLCSLAIHIWTLGQNALDQDLHGNWHCSQNPVVINEDGAAFSFKCLEVEIKFNHVDKCHSIVDLDTTFHTPTAVM